MTYIKGQGFHFNATENNCPLRKTAVFYSRLLEKDINGQSVGSGEMPRSLPHWSEYESV